MKHVQCLGPDAREWGKNGGGACRRARWDHGASRDAPSPSSLDLHHTHSPTPSTGCAAPAAPGARASGLNSLHRRRRAAARRAAAPPPRVASRAPPSARPPLAARRLPPADDSGCPLRSWPVIGALIPLTVGGDVACPQAIVALRAAVARVPAVRALRPRPVWLKGGAVLLASTTAATPFGAARVHTRKFSPAWFAAVHATIPFVAALRQATDLPRWALVLTLAGSVAGQFAGARLEGARLVAVAERENEARLAAVAPRRRRCSGPVCVPAAGPVMVVA